VINSISNPREAAFSVASQKKSSDSAGHPSSMNRDRAELNAEAGFGNLIVPTHAPTTAAEHNKFPKGRW